MIQIFRLLCLCFWMLLLPTGLLCAEGGDDVLARMIHLSKEKNTVYRLLDKVSEQTGFLFIYDSKLIDNEKTVRIPKGSFRRSVENTNLSATSIILHSQRSIYRGTGETSR